MKKTIINLSVILMTLIFCFACNDDNGSDKKPLKDDYFVIQDANYVDKKLPEGSDDLISGLIVNSTAITGGTAIVNVQTKKPVQKINVGVEGVKGYYELTPIYEDQKIGGVDVYNNQFIININQGIIVDAFVLNVSVSSDGKTSSVVSSNDIQVLDAGSGDLQISLSWDQEDDLDLHILDPNGNHIAYFDRMVFQNETDHNEWEVEFGFYCYIAEKYADYDTSGLDPENESDWYIVWDVIRDLKYNYIEELTYYCTSKGVDFGYLDIDSNADCDIDGIKNENIFFNNPTNGVYTVAIDLYSKCDFYRKGSSYAVSLQYKGKTIEFSNNQNGKFADDEYSNYNDPNGYVVIGTFTVGDASSSAKTKKARPAAYEAFKAKRMEAGK